MNRRRATVGLSALVAAPFFAFALGSRNVPAIGLLHPGFAGGISGADSALDSMLAGLGSLGYNDGQTIKIEYRWAQGKTETLPALARELIKLKVDLIVAIAPSAVKAAMAATPELPIVAHDLESDPVAAGLASSLARPGGNPTGLFLNHADLAAKRLQQFTEIKPGARHLEVLSDANAGLYQLDAIGAAASAISAELSVLEFRGEGAIQSALAPGFKSRPDAFVQLGSPLVRAASKAIATALAAQRMPGISPYRTFVEGGDLLSYGVNLPVVNCSLAAYAARILRGARAQRPADRAADAFRVPGESEGRPGHVHQDSARGSVARG